MLTLNSDQTVVASSSFKNVSWLFKIEIVGNTYFWSTKNVTFSDQDYLFKIINFDGIELSGPKSEYGIQAPSELKFSILNSDGGLVASNFIDQTATISLIGNPGYSWSEVEDLTEEKIALGVFGNYIYAGTYPEGRIYRSSDGLTWSLAWDSAENRIRCFRQFGNYFYAGSNDNGKIFRSSDGTTWAEVFDSPTETHIRCMAVFNSYLYAGTGEGAKVYRTANGVDWDEVADAQGDFILSLCASVNYIYAGTSPYGKIHRSSDGTTWAEVFDTGEQRVYSLRIFNGYLYAGTYPNGKIFRSSDGTTWAEVYSFTEAAVLSLTEFGNHLYAGTGTAITAKIYNTINGTHWIEVGTTPNDENIYSLTEFGNHLYAGTGTNGKIHRMQGDTLLATWKYKIKKSNEVDKVIALECESYITSFLKKTFPDTQLIKDIIPSNDSILDNLCVSLPIGVPYTPLRSIYITDQRYYVLGKYKPSDINLVVNGTFDTDTDWVKGTGWSISGGVASSDGTQTSVSYLSQSCSDIIIGRYYEVVYTITSYTSGAIAPVINSRLGISRASTGTYTEEILAVGTTLQLGYAANADFIGSIDNVSVKEINTYYVSKVHSPRDMGTSEWEDGYFPQSIKTINSVDWVVFQAIIADSDNDKILDSNGLWLQGENFLDMPTEFTRDDTKFISGNKTGSHTGSNNASSLNDGTLNWQQMVNLPETVTYCLKEFNSYLYAGTTNGGIYRSLDGKQWTQVRPPSSAQMMYGMECFDGYLYAASLSDGILYRSASGTTWASVWTAPEGGIASLCEFGSYLYAGTGIDAGEANIYRSSDGTTWALVGDFAENRTESMCVFNGYLYAGVGSATGEGDIYRSSDGTTWAKVFDSSEDIVYCMAVFNSYLYAGTYGKIFRSSDGTTWTLAYDPDEPGVLSLCAFSGYLYAGTFNTPTPGKIYRTSDGTTWAEINANTSDEMYIYSIAEFKDCLYAGTGINGLIVRGSTPFLEGKLVGLYLINKTDGSYGEIIENTGTAISATLSGGTDNDWDTNDQYTIGGPASTMKYILELLGVSSNDIDDTSFMEAEKIYAGWGLKFNGAFNTNREAGDVLAELLVQSHSVLRNREKICLNVISKTSQTTIDNVDVLKQKGGSTKSTFEITQNEPPEYDSGYIAFQESGKPQDQYMPVLVTAKTTTESIDTEQLKLPFVQDTEDVQRIGTLYYQRKLLIDATGKFSSKGTNLALEPEDVVTISHTRYGGSYAVIVDSVKIGKGLSLDITFKKLNVSMDDWSDLAPSTIVIASDDSIGFWTPVIAGPGSEYAEVNLLPGDIKIATSATSDDYISLEVTNKIAISMFNDGEENLRIGNLNGFLGYASDIYGLGVGNSTNYLTFDSTYGLRLSVSAASGIVVYGGADIKLVGADLNPGRLIWDHGGGQYVVMASAITNGRLCIYPYSSNYARFGVGIDLAGDAKPFTHIYLDAQEFARMRTVLSANDYATVNIQAFNTGDARSYLIAKKAAGQSGLYLYASDLSLRVEGSLLRPDTTDVTDLGSAVYKWKALYATVAYLGNTGLNILDSDASHHLTIAPGSNLTADRTLTLTTGDAARTITLNGNPTLNDWFDQAVKQASSPTFANITVTTALTKGGNTVYTLVDRGDPAAHDWATASFTKDGTWYDLDCSSIVPAGAYAIIFHIEGETTTANQYFRLRENGNSNSINALHFRTSSANEVYYRNGIVACDSSRVVEYTAQNATWTQLNVTVRGWFV